MGCHCSRFTNDKTKSKTFFETQVGLLDLHINNGEFYDQNLYQKLGKNPTFFLKIQVSNQDYVTRTCSDFSSDGCFNSYFSFFINSNYRANGRILQIDLHRKLEGDTSESLGKSIVDISKMIGVYQNQQEIKCILNNKKDPIGFINCLLTFNPMDYKTVSFKFTSFIRRKEPSCAYKPTHNQLRVELLLGEESLSTSASQDSVKQPPSWLKDILTFKVPNLLKFGKITIFEQGNVIGESVIKIQEIISVQEYKEFDCFSPVFDSKNIEVGSLKYSIIVGKNPKFSNNEVKEQIKVSQNARKVDEASIGSERSCKSSGVQILIKDRDSVETNEVGEERIGQKSLSGKKKVYMGGSAKCFSVFSIEDLQKLEKKEEK